jgi:hypothetical protein
MRASIRVGTRHSSAAVTTTTTETEASRTSTPTTGSSKVTPSATAVASSRFVPTPTPRPALAAWTEDQACDFFSTSYDGKSIIERGLDLGTARNAVAFGDKAGALKAAKDIYSYAQDLDDAAVRSPKLLANYYADMAEYEYSRALNAANAAYLNEDVINGVTPPEMDVPPTKSDASARALIDSCMG